MLEEERRFESEEEAEKFLYASFHNLLIDRVRMEVRWRVRDLEAAGGRRMTTAAHQEDDLIRERLSGRELPLPERERNVFEMAYFQGKSDREIADELQLNIHTVQRRLVRSRKALERIMVLRHGYSMERVKTLFSRSKG